MAFFADSELPLTAEATIVIADFDWAALNRFKADVKLAKALIVAASRLGLRVAAARTMLGPVAIVGMIFTIAGA